MSTSGKNSDSAPSPVTPRGIRRMGIYLVVLAALLVLVLAALWPVKGEGAKPWSDQFLLFGYCVGYLPLETRLIFIVMTAGALGTFIHTATSFATYVGNQTLVASWIWWYLMRPLIGMALALLFYLILQAGMLSAGTSPQSLCAFTGRDCREGSSWLFQLNAHRAATPSRSVGQPAGRGPSLDLGFAR